MATSHLARSCSQAKERMSMLARMSEEFAPKVQKGVPDWVPHAVDSRQACPGSVAKVGKQHEQIRDVDVAVAVQVALDSARRDLA